MQTHDGFAVSFHPRAVGPSLRRRTQTANERDYPCTEDTTLRRNRERERSNRVRRGSTLRSAPCATASDRHRGLDEGAATRGARGILKQTALVRETVAIAVKRLPVCQADVRHR